MLTAPLLLLLAAPPAGAAPRSFAVLAGRAPGDDPSDALGAATELAWSLREQGVEAVSGSGVWAHLGGQLREVGDQLPAGAEQLLADARQAFDDGKFARAAAIAEDLAARLDNSPRSVAVEARQREAELVAGFGERAAGQPAVGTSHWVWALARDPAIVADAVMFAPSLRDRLDEVRAGMAKQPHGSLRVTGTEGANVYVDGVVAGQAPLTLASLPRHTAWVWLERAGRRSLAHRVEMASASSQVAIDLDLDAHLGASPEGLPIFTAPRGDPETPRLLERLARAMGVPEVVVLSRCAGAGCWQLEGRVAGRALSLHREVGPGASLPVDELATDVLAGGGAAPVAKAAPAPESRAATKLGTETAAPPAATHVAVEPKAMASSHPVWPWLVGAAVVAVGAGVVIYLALQPSSAGPDGWIYASQGAP